MSVKDLLSESVLPPGLIYESDCISHESEQKIIKYIDEQEWNTTLSRRTQHYGYEYNYNQRGGSAALKKVAPVAGPLLSIAKHFIKNDTLLVNDENDLQCIVNEYKTGQGIAPHTDAKIFGDTIVCMSLGDPVNMIFKKNGSDKIISLKLDPRSVMTMTDEARSEWLHSIPKETRNRDFRRISITYRTVPK